VRKTEFLGEAAALLFPVDWPEPFGLVMEAMACGTPVLAFRCGPIPEVIDDGITGTLLDSEEEAIATLPGILTYDRHAARQRFEERFTSARMVKDYVSTYHKLLRARRRQWQGREHLGASTRWWRRLDPACRSRRSVAVSGAADRPYAGGEPLVLKRIGYCRAIRLATKAPFGKKPY